MMKRLVYLVMAMLLTACSKHPVVPAGSQPANAIPNIFPDYVEVTVPANIAPLNFMVTDPQVDEVVARVTSADGKVQTYGDGQKVQIPEEEWAEMRDASVGKSLKMELFCHRRDGHWLSFDPFCIHVADESIDRYVSYRLIEPSYMMYNRMSICQRDLTNFEEQEIFNNKVADPEQKGQCINCHSYQNYGTKNMLFHVRVTHGGTILVVDGKPRKVNLKRPNTISAGVYPAWHPQEQLIAFSTNRTHQWFHTSDNNKVEVFDDASDLVLYDIARDTVMMIADDSMRLEVFPAWSADGKWLYYCSANKWSADSLVSGDYRIGYEQLRYNLYRRQFSVEEGRVHWGDEELVYAADSLGRSCSLPRLSPDGEFLAFAEGAYGCFNIWHHEADIRVMRLSDGAFLDDSALNSPDYAESYPSFSSTSRWVMCASRRDDGNYSRIYIAYFDGQRLHKAFELPEEDPESYQSRLKSYNRPEFMTEPVALSIKELSRVVLND